MVVFLGALSMACFIGAAVSFRRYDSKNFDLLVMSSNRSIIVFWIFKALSRNCNGVDGLLFWLGLAQAGPTNPKLDHFERINSIGYLPVICPRWNGASPANDDATMSVSPRGRAEQICFWERATSAAHLPAPRGSAEHE